MNWRSIYDKVEQLCIMVAVHPFHWRLELDSDARDKAVTVTVGPITVAANW